jgi:hypothetical protein
MRKHLPHNAACVLCLSEPETALHLLATCSVTIRIWQKIIAIADLPAAFTPSPTTDDLHSWMQSTTQAMPQGKNKC